MSKLNANYKRILSAILAFVTVLTLLPMQAFSTKTEEVPAPEVAVETQSAQEAKSLKVTLDGVQISSVELRAHEKFEIVAQGVENAQYQWQILHPEKEDLWVNIYDATTESVPVTLALVGNMLSSEDVAQLRCRATADGEQVYSEAVAVRFLEEETGMTVTVEDAEEVLREEPAEEVVEVEEEIIEETSEAVEEVVEETTAPVEEAVEEVTAPAEAEEELVEEVTAPAEEAAEAAEEAVEAAEETVETEEVTELIDVTYENTPAQTYNAEPPEFVTVTINYDLYSYEDDGITLREPVPAFTPYVAALKSGSSLQTTVPCPTIVGYQAMLVDAGGNETPCDEVEINLTDIKADVVYTVNYKPAEVDYEVRYFFQNIYDDLYVEDATLVKNTLSVLSYPVVATGKTGTNPDTTYTQAEFAGFTSLYYEPEKIAADGSTVFHVYYERNYCLMEFDCNGGYGTDTVYVRYGTYISVPNPVKSGYTFAGWDLERTDDTNYAGTLGDGVADTVPANMPSYNTAYKAIWDQADTTYSVAYWILDAEGNKTYIGNRTVNATTGDEVDGLHDLTNTTLICGSEAHDHSDACYVCGKTEHKHTQGNCFDGMTLASVPGTDSNRDAAIADLEGGAPESGYIYVIYNPDSGTYWPKIYLEDSNGNGAYYVINGTQGGSTEDSFSAIVDGNPIASKTGTYGTETLTTTKYRPKTSCNTIQHIHSGACRTCKAHTHSDACYPDVTYLKAVNADQDVEVQGDGSTVVNVYYEYLEYTLKFYYAKTQGGTATDNDNDATTYDEVRVVGGSTWNFGTNTVPGPDDGPQLANVDNWGLVDEFPTLNTDGQKRNYTNGSLTYGDYTYHYISFKARYGDNIADLWPCSVFNSVTRIDSNTHGNWSGKEAFVSAWNGEHRVKYTQDHGNETIKGKYELLDENLLFDLTRFDDSEEVSYLCFWENGDNVGWSIPELYRYNIWVEARSSELNADNTGLITKEYDGVVYKLIDTYDTCDDSNPNSQTQTALTGYTPSGRDFSEITDFDTSLYKEAYEVNFYYTANRHSLKFWNYNDWLGDGQGAGNTEDKPGVQYGTPLKNYGAYVNEEYMKSHYPDGLEPGAYKFGGWYTAELCLPGTEMDWENMTMPDADLIVYAKWTPVVHDVYFYYDYEDYISATTANENDKRDYYWYHVVDGVKTPESYPIKVTHGNLLGTTYSNTPDPKENYTFVGWFYIDDTGKKRFAPDTMEVKSELHLFAEWQSGIDTEYTVNYVLDTDNTVIAAATTGHLTAGKTKTFTAKVGKELNVAYQDKPLFPMSNSHSILMAEESEQNTYTFRYKEDNVVYYRVRYLDKITNIPLHDDKVEKSTKAIVTEKFVPVVGYVPESYYIRKVLAYDANATEPTEQNEIIFYYTPDTEHGPFVVEYYTPVLGATDEQLYKDGKPYITLDDDSANPYWHLEQSELGTADLDVEISRTIDADKFDGFEYDQTTITTYDTDGNPTTTQTNETSVSGTVTQNGLEIRIFYARKSYPYTIQYIEYGTDNILRTETFTGNNAAPFESTVSHTAPDTFEKTVSGEITKYIFYPTAEKPQSQDWTIRASNTENVLTFYYQVKTVGIIYQAVCSVDGAVNFGVVDLNYEKAATAKNISGSNAIVGDGFVFKGWFTDKAGTNPVPESWRFDPGPTHSANDDVQSDAGTKLKPQSLQDVETVTYYALFEPAKEDLKIIKTGTGIDEDHTFLFRVTGTNVLGQDVDMIVSIQGKSSVTLKDLYCGDYTVTELTGWSWTYSCTDGASKEVKLTTKDELGTAEKPNTVTFTNSSKEVDWLHGESEAAENQFTVKEITT